METCCVVNILNKSKGENEMSVKFKLNLYQLSPLGKVKTGESRPVVRSDFNNVGGTIFYIDATSDETVEFRDEHGELMEDVGVGSRPFAYRVLNPGTSGKKKYYIFYPQIWGSKRWTWYDTETDPENPAYVYNSLGTANTIGSGKTNTDIVMAADNGKYITNNSNGAATVWYIIQQMRDGNYGGCDDWFLASRAELEELRLFMNAHPEVLTELNITNWFSNNHIWSSAEASAQDAWFWGYTNQAWYSNGKNDYYSVCGVRAL